MNKLREVLLNASASADYSKPELSEQREAVDVFALEGLVERIASRAIVVAHAVDVMKEDNLHPMQAFLHAAHCPATGVELSDSEFFATLAMWGRLCEAAHPANGARPVEMNPIYQSFMRGE